MSDRRLRERNKQQQVNYKRILEKAKPQMFYFKNLHQTEDLRI